MKKNLSLLLFVLAFLTACRQPKSVTADLNAEEIAVNAIIDNWEATTQTDTLAKFLSEDALVAGTASKELWTKKEVVELWRQYYAGIMPNLTYINKRILKMAADGKSATVLEEYIMPAMSPVIPARNTIHLVKTDGRWMIDFLSIAFIPKNEDLPIIDGVLSNKK